MLNETLYFSPKSQEFYFKSRNPNVEKIHRIQYKSFPKAGRVNSFLGAYPMGVTSLKDFKAVLPKGKAAESAMHQIQYLKSVPELLENFTTVNGLEYTFSVAPYVHQLQALEFMLNYPRLGLGLAMGLGKTFIAVHYLDITKRRALVFGPVIVMDTWMKEIKKFTNLKAVLYRGTAKQREKIRESVLHGEDQDWDILVSNFEGPKPTKTGKADYYFYHKLEYDCVIIDEASRLQGHDKERSKIICELAEGAFYRYLLSGTLSKGKPTDIFVPFKVMDSEILGSNYWEFRRKYCEFSPYNKHVITGYKNLDDLKMLIDPYMLIKDRDECIDLPERTFIIEEYEMSAEQRDVYDAIKDNDTVWLPLKGGLKPSLERPSPDTHGEIRCGMPLIKLNKLRQILSGFIILSHERDYRLCNTCDALLQCMFPEDGSEKEVFPWDKECQKYNPEHPVRKPARRVLFFKKNPKLELLKELLTDLGVNSVQQEKAIIWVMYKPDLVLIGDMLDKAKIPYVTSDTPQCESAFQDNKSNLVFLSQVSAGVGLTLTSAVSMINYSYSLDLDHRLQSLERNYRIGQDRKTLVKDLVHPVSVEDGILAMLAKKQDVKDFMQSTNVCMKCPTTKRMECLERQVWPYAQDCIHYETRLAAEKKEAIKIV